MWFVLRCKLVGEMARTRHSVFEAKVDVSTLLIKEMMIVDRASRGRRQLRLLLCLFLNLSAEPREPRSSSPGQCLGSQTVFDE